MMRVLVAMIGILTALQAQPSYAQTVNITADMASSTFTVGARTFEISRTQDPDATLQGEFAKTNRPCPDFCIQPMIIASGVAPIGELEVIAFLQTEVAAGTGILIDARLPDWYEKGAIPAAVNVPFAALGAENPYLADILHALGAIEVNGEMTFDAAQDLVVYDNGAWDEQATRAITSLITAGYPASMIKNYRGGLQDWLHFGLSTVLP